MYEDIGGRIAFDDLISAVLEAGELALNLYREGAGGRAQKKPDRSPVTEADQKVEAQLAAFVKARFPDARFFGEEHGGDRARSAGLRFVVDPIDGTRAFMRGLPSWSILVGVELDGEPHAGVAYMPAAGDLFTAVRGEGAYVNGRPVRLSAVETLEDALVCHGGLAQFVDDGREDKLGALARQTYTQRGLADFASYRALLLGQADAVVDPMVQPYDVAAAAVLIREAGGKLTSLTGEDTIYGPGALASNGHVHEALVQLLK
ncbi:MAG TPA: inositol monophosphatase [Polyangiales bacterium]|nr:inositol monophosphatase [Polyangiales bacterium]